MYFEGLLLKVYTHLRLYLLGEMTLSLRDVPSAVGNNCCPKVYFAINSVVPSFDQCLHSITFFPFNFNLCASLYSK